MNSRKYNMSNMIIDNTKSKKLSEILKWIKQYLVNTLTIHIRNVDRKLNLEQMRKQFICVEYKTYL